MDHVINVTADTYEYLSMTTTGIKRFFTKHTTSGRKQALDELLEMVEQRHQHFVDKILPTLRTANRMGHFRDAHVTTHRLNAYDDSSLS